MQNYNNLGHKSIFYLFNSISSNFDDRIVVFF